MEYKEFLALAKKRGFTKIQITTDVSISKEIYYINNTLEDYIDSNKTTYIVKGEYKGKVEEVLTEYLDESILDLLIEKIELVDSNYENVFITTASNNTPPVKEKVSIKKEAEEIKKLSQLKDNYPQVKNIEFYYGDEYSETRIINSNGVDISTSSHVYSFTTEATAEEKDSITSFSKSKLVTNRTDIDFSSMATTVLKNSIISVNKETLATKKYNIIIDSSVVSDILKNFVSMISATTVNKNMSCLTGKLNEKIFSDKLTIVEEPHNKQYPGYIIFDKEGVPTFNKEIVKNGILKTYLYDNKEAKQNNTNSTGNSYGNINTRNMYILPGKLSLKELQQKMENGIYITSKMGAMGTSINESTGNISIQIFGFIIKDGKISGGFTPAVMSTTIFELLSNIEEIGNDLSFKRKSTGAPSLYIKDISIAAE